MFGAISALDSDSTWLDVIGNNIANVNTVAYKSSRLEFATQISQTLSNGFADNPAEDAGGVDPQEVGLGTRIASIQTLFAPGPTETTGVSTDISIQGGGFLIAKQGDQTYLTRAGDLTFDSGGYLVNPEGQRIQGYNATMQYNQDFIDTVSNVPGQPLTVTQASLALSDTSLGDLSSIQINQDMVLPPKATTEVNFVGNLDSFQQPNVVDLFPGFFNGNGGPTLPVGLTIAAIGPANAIDPARVAVVPTNDGGFALSQVEDLSNFIPGNNPPPAPLENGYINLGFVQAFAGSYVWDQQPPVPPAAQATETVYDSLGNPRQITVQFYQVNDLGADGINNPNGPNQVLYAWYAFDTTGGKPVSTADLLGGTGIGEGDYPGNPGASYNRDLANQGFFGDFLWFNTDGSLASSGGVGGLPGPPGLNANYMTMPRVYLPPLDPDDPPVSPIPTQGAEIDVISLNFGNFGLLGGNGQIPVGTRDGVYSDAEGSYQVVNGVNTYVPNSTVYAASQNGYSDGVLQGLEFDSSGTINGTFSNGQTVALAQVALAQVQNSDGLAQVGNNDFTLSPNAGPEQVGQAGHGTFGTIEDDTLEGSNVDLSVELSNMIIAQRSFETNARVIAVINDELQVLTTLGQGG